MAKRHAVVDGSNLATEGRTEPSLAQLDEAVGAFNKDHEFAHVTVVVDASFEHRVPSKEKAAVKKAIDSGRIITPPAGAIGRGDAFILQIADRADAVVLSNDSFQEFHGEFEWLFDEGRLIGGKPIEHVGWVFVARAPVRGPTSRKAVRAAQKSSARPEKPAKASAKAGKSRSASAKSSASSDSTSRSKAKPAPTAEKSSQRKSGADGENPLRAWQRFRRENPVGSSVSATVERFSSHGAYALTGDGLSAYLPLRLLGDPAPNRARDVISVGEQRDFVVHEYHDDRRGIDIGLLPAPDGQGDDDGSGTAEKAPSSGRRRRSGKRGSAADGDSESSSSGPTPARKAAAKKTAKKPAARKSTAKKAAADKTVKKSGARKTTAKKTAKKPAARKRTTRKAAGRDGASEPESTGRSRRSR